MYHEWRVICSVRVIKTTSTTTTTTTTTTTNDNNNNSNMYVHLFEVL